MSLTPVITKKIAAGYMIMRGGPGQTGKKNAEWLSPEGIWEKCIFEGAAFKKRRDAEVVLEELKKGENHEC